MGFSNGRLFFHLHGRSIGLKDWFLRILQMRRVKMIGDLCGMWILVGACQSNYFLTDLSVKSILGLI